MKNITRRCAGLCARLVWLGTLLTWAGWAWAAQPAMPTPGTGPASAPPGTADFAFVQPWFENVGDAESILEGVVTALAQDARGLIWIGTQHGLVRYDGYRFRRFVHDAGDPASLAGDYVFSLWAAKDGRLWVGGMSDGLSVFDPESERFEHFRHDAKRPDSLGAGRISALAGDARGGLWIATDQGLDHLPGNGKGLVHYRHDDADPRSLSDDKIRSLLINRQGRLFVGSVGGLQRLAQDGKGFEPIAKAIDVQSLFEAQDGKLWLGTSLQGAAWLAPGSDTPHWLALNQTGPASAPARTDALSHPWVWGIAQARADQIWLASNGGGINIVAADDGRILRHVRRDQALPGGLALDQVKSLLLDRAGMLWVGTWGGGLQRCQWLGDKGGTPLWLRHGRSQPGGLSHPDVRSVLELANGRILFGSNGNGIDVFDRRRGLVGGHRADRGPGALPDAAINTMAQTGDGALWAGTQQAGVVRMPAGGHEWQAVPGLPTKVVLRLVRGRDGGLWAATSRGLARWQAGQAGFQAVPDEHGKPMRSGIWALAEDRHGRVWAGGVNGLWVMEPGGAGLHAIHPEPGRADGLVSGQIAGLLVDSRGRLWVATDKGLERLLQWDGGIARFEHVDAMLGHPGQALGANLLEDKAGRIWSETAMIDPLRMRMVSLGKADGIGGASWVGSHGQTRDDLLFFGGAEGVIIIDPALFRAWDYVPPLVATELKINGKAVPLGALASARPGLDAPPLPPSPLSSLTLTPEQRDFALEFAALDFSEPKKNRYQYRLQGYDKTWIDTDSEHRSAAYGNLWPGRYTLQVRGSNRMGDWSPHELAIAIRVLPAWYQTWWFGALMLLGLTAAVAALVQARTGYLRRRQVELERQVRERTLDLQHKQQELLVANQNLHDSNSALNQSNSDLNQSNSDLNQSNSNLNQAISDLNQSNSDLNQSNSNLNQAISDLNQSNSDLNESNSNLNQAILDLNQANTELQLSVETLRQLGDIGRDITANLDQTMVFQALYAYVGGLLDTQVLSIYRMNAATRELDLMFGRENDAPLPARSLAIDSPTSNVARAARERRELLRDMAPDAVSPSHVPGTRQMHTALFAPLLVDERLLGVMSIQSERVHAYGERERLIFRTLCAYGAIALANADALAALQQAQKHLVQQEKLASLGGLVAGIAHEINTPLGTSLMAISAIDGAWDRLSQAVASGKLSKSVLQSSTDDGKEYTALAHRTASRAAELIRTFKTIALHTDGDRMEEVDLAQFVPEIVSLLHSPLVQAGIELKLDMPASLPVKIVSEALIEALTRILTNVIDHAFIDSQPGCLKVRAAAGEREDVLLEISDNGHGIAAADLPKVFDPFFTTRSGMHGHVGLGLHVAFNHVTQRLKGGIEIASTLGEGTKVTMRFKSA